MGRAYLPMLLAGLLGAVPAAAQQPRCAYPDALRMREALHGEPPRDLLAGDRVVGSYWEVPHDGQGPRSRRYLVRLDGTGAVAHVTRHNRVFGADVAAYVDLDADGRLGAGDLEVSGSYGLRAAAGVEYALGKAFSASTPEDAASLARTLSAAGLAVRELGPDESWTETAYRADVRALRAALGCEPRTRSVEDIIGR